MKKALAMITALTVLVLLISGCSASNEKTKDFNKHISEIDKQINEVNKLQTQSEKYLASLGKLSSDKATLKKCVSNVDKVVSLTDKEIDHLDFAIAEAKAARQLNASKESSKYAQMLEQSFRTRLKSYKLMSKGLDSFKNALNKVIANQITDSAKFQVEANVGIKMLNTATKLENKAKQQHKAAQEYYKENVKKN